jgi:hypothetical protein
LRFVLVSVQFVASSRSKSALDLRQAFPLKYFKPAT